MGTHQIEEFNVIQFEKKLTTLKDRQDSINVCCKWCLENRSHHKKIVNSWLNVLKRVKIEQRLVLFYLANDVIQYSKRKHYEFVESWGTALQKATTLVRDEKVKHKIVRIFNIWQQRDVYNEEFISDLCGLISVVPTASKNDEAHEFQSSCVINKIKQCSKLESETDGKLKILKEDNPKIQIETESLCTSLKDRAHVDDVEKELETYVTHLEGYINALKAEIKCRISNISVLKQAETQLEKDKKDVKVVANAYRVFGNKVRTFQKKLDEHRQSIASPIPSPDINAPSPSPDCDIELPDEFEPKKANESFDTTSLNFLANYYNPVPPPVETPANFITNGYTSFIGSNFSLDTPIFANNENNQLQKGNEVAKTSDSSNFVYESGSHMPLLPPPMPPFNPNDPTYNQSYSNDKLSFQSDYNQSESNFNSTSYNNSFDDSNGYNNYSVGGGTNDEYNPEQELDTWEPDSSWSQPPPSDTDTPESPPNFEKECYIEGVEYHDGGGGGGGGCGIAISGAKDVDHRLIHQRTIESGRKDVDHRNLISLTGSPLTEPILNENKTWKRLATNQDYNKVNLDQDYRRNPPPPFNIDQLKLPPPPPPPIKPQTKKASPRKPLQDNVESIDMDLSEDEPDDFQKLSQLKPPPPLPDLPDDIDANSFLDDLDNDLNSNEFTANLQDLDQQQHSNRFYNNNGRSGMHPIMNHPPQMQFPPPPPPSSLPNTWMDNGPPPPPPPNFMGPPSRRGFGGRPPGRYPSGNNNNNNNRGGRHFHHSNGGRGGFRGGPNFRSRGFNRGGSMRSHNTRGNKRGKFQGGY